MSEGAYNPALVLGPPSPVLPTVPVPAKVLTMPAELIKRILWLLKSAINTFPLISTDTEKGLKNLALIADPPSPVLPTVEPA